MNAIRKTLWKWPLLVAALAIAAPGARASNDGWSGEFTPYFFGAGAKGDVTVRNRTVSPDITFDDLFKKVHGGFSFLSSADYERLVGYVQMDWFRLKDDQSTGLGNAHLDTDFVDSTFAGGRRFDGFNDKSSVDVMAGLRYTHVSNHLTVAAFDGSSRRDLIDGVAVLRPRYRFLSRLSFSPTVSLGAGQSDFTYELSPQFQFDFTKNLLARVGYRRLHYKFHDVNGAFDGALHGFIVGVGYQF